jgi:hypothetical protein
MLGGFAREFGRRGLHIETKRLLSLFRCSCGIYTAEHSIAFRSGNRCVARPGLETTRTGPAICDEPQTKPKVRAGVSLVKRLVSLVSAPNPRFSSCVSQICLICLYARDLKLRPPPGCLNFSYFRYPKDFFLEIIEHRNMLVGKRGLNDVVGRLETSVLHKIHLFAVHTTS